VIAQAITELDNKTAHCQPPVLDRHTQIFRCRLYRQINHVPHRVARWEYVAFLYRLADNAVQRFIQCIPVPDKYQNALVIFITLRERIMQQFIKSGLGDIQYLVHHLAAKGILNNLVSGI
jgi:hypothetical protein